MHIEELLKRDAEFHHQQFLNSNPPVALKELYLKVQAIAQPYIDKMNADPLNFSQSAALHAELTEKITAIMWEYELRQDATK